MRKKPPEQRRMLAASDSRSFADTELEIDAHVGLASEETVLQVIGLRDKLLISSAADTLIKLDLQPARHTPLNPGPFTVLGARETETALTNKDAVIHSFVSSEGETHIAYLANSPTTSAAGYLKSFVLPRRFLKIDKYDGAGVKSTLELDSEKNTGRHWDNVMAISPDGQYALFLEKHPLTRSKSIQCVYLGKDFKKWIESRSTDSIRTVINSASILVEKSSTKDSLFAATSEYGSNVVEVRVFERSHADNTFSYRKTFYHHNFWGCINHVNLFHRGGKAYLITSHDLGNVSLYSLNTTELKIIGHLSLDHISIVHKVIISPDQNLIIACTNHGPRFIAFSNNLLSESPLKLTNITTNERSYVSTVAGLYDCKDAAIIPAGDHTHFSAALIKQDLFYRPMVRTVIYWRGPRDAAAPRDPRVQTYILPIITYNPSATHPPLANDTTEASAGVSAGAGAIALGIAAGAGTGHVARTGSTSTPATPDAHAIERIAETETRAEIGAATAAGTGLSPAGSTSTLATPESRSIQVQTLSSLNKEQFKEQLLIIANPELPDPRPGPEFEVLQMQALTISTISGLLSDAENKLLIHWLISTAEHMIRPHPKSATEAENVNLYFHLSILITYLLALELIKLDSRGLRVADADVKKIEGIIVDMFKVAKTEFWQSYELAICIAFLDESLKAIQLDAHFIKPPDLTPLQDPLNMLVQNTKEFVDKLAESMKKSGGTLVRNAAGGAVSILATTWVPVVGPFIAVCIGAHTLFSLASTIHENWLSSVPIPQHFLNLLELFSVSYKSHPEPIKTRRLIELLRSITVIAKRKSYKKLITPIIWTALIGLLHKNGHKSDAGISSTLLDLEKIIEHAAELDKINPFITIAAKELLFILKSRCLWGFYNFSRPLQIQYLATPNVRLFSLRPTTGGAVIPPRTSDPSRSTFSSVDTPAGSPAVSLASHTTDNPSRPGSAISTFFSPVAHHTTTATTSDGIRRRHNASDGTGTEMVRISGT